MGDFHFTILFVYESEKIRRSIDVKTVEELYSFAARELKVQQNRLHLKYFDPEFEELVTLDDLSCVPQKVKIEVSLSSPREHEAEEAKEVIEDSSPKVDPTPTPTVAAPAASMPETLQPPTPEPAVISATTVESESEPELPPTPTPSNAELTTAVTLTPLNLELMSTPEPELIPTPTSSNLESVPTTTTTPELTISQATETLIEQGPSSFQLQRPSNPPPPPPSPNSDEKATRPSSTELPHEEPTTDTPTEMPQEVEPVRKRFTLSGLPGGILKLSVGGEYYSTSFRTIFAREPECYLLHLLAGMEQKGQSLSKDSSGRFEIPRDGKLFGIIIDYLREGAKLKLPSESKTLRDLLVEAEFFQMKNLQNILRPIVAQLPPDLLEEPESHLESHPTEPDTTSNDSAVTIPLPNSSPLAVDIPPLEPSPVLQEDIPPPATEQKTAGNMSKASKFFGAPVVKADEKEKSTKLSKFFGASIPITGKK